MARDWSSETPDRVLGLWFPADMDDSTEEARRAKLLYATETLKKANGVQGLSSGALGVVGGLVYGFGPDGRWHAFGITHPAVAAGEPNPHEAEWLLFHAAAPAGG